MLSTTNGSSYRKHVRGAEFASILGSTVGLYSFVIYLKIIRSLTTPRLMFLLSVC